MSPCACHRQKQGDILIPAASNHSPLRTSGHVLLLIRDRHGLARALSHSRAPCGRVQLVRYLERRALAGYLKSNAVACQRIPQPLGLEISRFRSPPPAHDVSYRDRLSGVPGLFARPTERQRIFRQRRGTNRGRCHRTEVVLSAQHLVTNIVF